MSFREWVDSRGLFSAYLCPNCPYIDQEDWPLPAAVGPAFLSTSLSLPSNDPQLSHSLVGQGQSLVELPACVCLRVCLCVMAVNQKANEGLWLGAILGRGSQACSKQQALFKLNQSCLIIQPACLRCMTNAALCRTLMGQTRGKITCTWNQIVWKAKLYLSVPQQEHMNCLKSRTISRKAELFHE